MTTLREAAQMALDALLVCIPDYERQAKRPTELQRQQMQAIEALRAALAQREWQTLTENEIKHLWYEACQTNLELTSQLVVHLARNVEAKLKEKNHG